MKKGITSSLLAFGLIASANLGAADDLSSMFSEGKVSGEIRSFYINRDDTSKPDNQIATAIGGKLLYETGSYKGISLGAGFYTTNRILRNLESTDKTMLNNTLFRNDGESYSILGEAYVKYNAKAMGTNTIVKVGRQRLDTPLAGSDDARMLPNLFEAAVVINNDVQDTTLILAHVTKMAPGTFANAYNGGIVGATAGYTAVAGNTAEYQGSYVGMGTWAVGHKTDGVTAASAIYAHNDLKVQLWDYYAHNILNAIYGQIDYSMKMDSLTPYVSAQVIKEDAVGNKLVKGIGGDGEVDSLYWGAKAGVKVAGLNTYVAYSKTSANNATDAAYKNAIISPWGGMPAFTQGMVTRHQFLAGTKATKFAATYDFNKLGVNLSATGYYALFKMDANSGYGTARTTIEPGFDLQYHPEAIKNLLVRLRGNFPNQFGNNRDWDEYRFILSYNF